MASPLGSWQNSERTPQVAVRFAPRDVFMDMRPTIAVPFGFLGETNPGSGIRVAPAPTRSIERRLVKVTIQAINGRP